jgi:hypothetical protein
MKNSLNASVAAVAPAPYDASPADVPSVATDSNERQMTSVGSAGNEAAAVGPGALADLHGVPSCPSASPDAEGAVIFGVAGGTLEEPRVGYLARAVKPTRDLLALAAPADPAAVFRFGGRCAESACSHFSGAHCTLGERLVQLLPAVTERLPACALRPSCRWWQEQGPAACRRCPQVITQSDTPSAELALAAAPPAASALSSLSSGLPRMQSPVTG